jgi:hypothetical protein
MKRKYLRESERRFKFNLRGEERVDFYKVPRQCPFVLLIKIEWE